LRDGQVRVRVDSLRPHREQRHLCSLRRGHAATGSSSRRREEGWGIVPVWGFGTRGAVDCILAWRSVSACGATGRWAPASVLQPAATVARARIHRHGATPPRGAACRLQPVPALQPAIRSTRADSRGRRRRLLRPLFTTSWLIDDFLADNEFFGAKHRAALQCFEQDGLRHGLPACSSGTRASRRTGFTSARQQVAFCESLGCYDRVLAYEELAQHRCCHALCVHRLRGQRRSPQRPCTGASRT
jgi:hypothetical protein